jgi:toxin ParE1/3/4
VTILVWSPRASADLESIRAYIAQDSPFYADLVVRRLITAPERLTNFPEIGRIVPEVGSPQLRELIVRPFRIVYRIRPDVIEIATVFRSARQLPADIT